MILPDGPRHDAWQARLLGAGMVRFEFAAGKG